MNLHGTAWSDSFTISPGAIVDSIVPGAGADKVYWGGGTVLNTIDGGDPSTDPGDAIYLTAGSSVDGNAGSGSATLNGATVSWVSFEGELGTCDNTPPVLDTIGDKFVNEEASLEFTVTASDADDPPDTLTFAVTGLPWTASFDRVTGAFSWTPVESLIGSYTMTFAVYDDGTPGYFDSETVTITVNEVNIAPVLNPIGSQTVDEHSNLSFTATATDDNLPANSLTYSLDDGADGSVPTGATIDPNTGVFNWTPMESQGLGTHTFDVVVKDDGVPQLSDRETITVTVNEVNIAPVLNPIGSQTVDEHSNLSFTATATDDDLPANSLTYSLDDGAYGSVPTGAMIDPNTGVFNWTPHGEPRSGHAHIRCRGDRRRDATTQRP